MLTEERVRALAARRIRVILPAMAVAVGAVFLYLPVAGSFRGPLIAGAVGLFGDRARDVAPFALILPTLAIFLVPNWLAEKYAARFKIGCPLCDADLSTAVRRILSTRCCPGCGGRILEGGRPHSAAVHRRHQAIRLRHVLRSWFWAWPALGGVVLTWHAFDRSAFRDCPHHLWLGPLIGTVAAGWTWLRTFDRCYVPPLLASAALLGLGASLSCRTW